MNAIRQNNFYQSALLNELKVTHGFFTNNHGHSSGIYKSLNCSLKSADNKNNVLKNRISISKTLNFERLFILEQTHSNHIINLDQPSPANTGDAIISADHKKLIGVLTADCVPILLYNRASRKVAAVHAGWRGAFDKIIQNAVKSISNNFPQNTFAAIGPCIRTKNYEVSHDFYLAFIRSDQTYKKFFQAGRYSNKYFFDIAKFCRDKLNKSGVTAIDDLQIDTYENANLFFSCRRSFHENKKDFGCQASVISSRLQSH